jgi:tetratricopeptide (TPR) repeat protein
MRFFVLFITVALLSQSAFAQSTNFTVIENRIKEFVSKAQWDEVMLAAPELITEEPARGEGFYYTALAFSKLGEAEKAREYLSHAEGLADANLKVKIESLKADINTTAKANQLSETVKNNGDAKNSAADYRKLWELNKSKVEYAMSAIELYVEQEDYPAALAILNDPVMSQDAEAKKLIARLNQTPKMKTLNGYNSAMKEGESKYNQGYYQSAISKFEEALSFISKDTKASSMRRKATEELAWQTAKNTHTIDSYKFYLSKYPLGVHKSEADDILQRSYLKIARDYVKSNDFNNAVDYYKTYQSAYANGPQITTVNKELCDLYFAEAQKTEKGKTSYNMSRSIELYGLARQCGDGRVDSKHLKALKRKQIRWGREDMFFWGWHADEKNLYGFMSGSLNNRKLGMYVAARAGEGDDVFESSDTYWETDNNNSLAESVSKDKKFTGTVYHPTLYATIGLTKKLVYPFWIYGGAGVAVRSELKEFINTGTGTERGKTELVKNKEAAYVAVNPEIGLQVQLAFLTIRYGVNKPITPLFTEQFVQHFGVAIKM